MSDNQLERTDNQGKTTAVQPAMNNREDRLLEKVLESGNIEVLERFIALRKSEEERADRKEFERRFAEMRKLLPKVTKTNDNKAFGSKYAKIEDLQRDCDPIIFQHGFSYSWREEAIDSGKRVWMDIFGHGHTKSNYFDVPTIQGNNAQNAIHIAGTMSAYGRRYTFVSGFGVVVESEDHDGNLSFDDAFDYREDLAAIEKTTDQKALRAVAGELHRKFDAKNDAKGVQVVAKAFAKQKANLDAIAREIAEAAK